MESDINMHDVVALLEDVHARAFRNRSPTVAAPRAGRHGRHGTAFEVEFAGKDGRAYALVPVHASKLMILRDTPDYAVA